jgi:hypothetical protein
MALVSSGEGNVRLRGYMRASLARLAPSLVDSPTPAPQRRAVKRERR